MKNKTTTTKLAMLAALLFSLLLTLACTEGGVSATGGTGADADAKETFPQVSVPEGEGYHLLGSSGTMPAALASELFEAGGTLKQAALDEASFNGTASDYVWLAHVKQYRFDSSAYRTANNIADVDEIPEDVYNKYNPVTVLQKDENITAYVGFSKEGSLGSDAKLAFIYNTTSYQFTRHLSEWNGGATPDDDAFSISYKEGEDDGYEEVRGALTLFYAGTEPTTNIFNPCAKINDNDAWNNLGLSIHRDTPLCILNYIIFYNLNDTSRNPYYFYSNGPTIAKKTIMINNDIPFYDVGSQNEFYFYSPSSASAFASASEAGEFFKRLSGN